MNWVRHRERLIDCARPESSLAPVGVGEFDMWVVSAVFAVACVTDTTAGAAIGDRQTCSTVFGLSNSA
jgi:hypothetical protein